MREFLAAGVLCGLLAACLAGGAAAVSTDANVKDIYWNVGTEGYIAGNYTRGMYSEYFTVPASTGLTYTAPLTVPSVLAGKNCSVKRVYLYWSGPASLEVQSVQVATAGAMLGTWTIGDTGTGGDHLVTVNLEGSYPVPRGLVMQFFIANTGSEATCYIKGYGAMIKHAV